MAAVLEVENRRLSDCGKIVQRLVFDWTSDGSGNASVAFSLTGFLLKMITDPAAGGSAPTDNYDITMIDEDGSDVLLDLGLNRDTANTETVYPVQTGATVPVFACGTVTFTVANAGSAKSGRAVAYVLQDV